MESVYQNVERSEQEYFDDLRKRDKREADIANKAFEQLQGLSKGIKKIVKQRHDKYVEEEEAKGNMLALTKGVTIEELDAFRAEEESLRQGDIKATKFAYNYEKDTGDFITGEEFRNLSGYAQYSFVKASVLNEAKNYQKYKYEQQEIVELPVYRNGQLEIIKYGDEGVTQQEQDAINDKIKFNFIKRFNGINRVLFNTTVGEEIRRIDALDHREEVQKRHEAIKAARVEKEKFEIKANFGQADPASASKFARDWVDIHKEEYTIEGARAKFEDYVVDLVKDGQIPVDLARNAVLHKFEGRDRSEKNLESWKQWDDFNDRLLDAHYDYMTVEDQRKASEVDAIVSGLKRGEDYSFPQKQEIKRQAEAYFGYLPEEIRNELAEYEDNDAAKVRLNQALASQDGKIFDYQLINTSPSIKNAYQSYVRKGGALELGTAEAKDAMEMIDIYTNEILNTNLGPTNAKTLRWKRLNIGLQSVFNKAYKAAIDDGNLPMSAAYTQGITAIEKIKNTKDAYKAFLVVDTIDEKELEFKNNITIAETQGANNGWKTTRLAASTEDEEKLVEWSKGPRNLQDIPEYYRQLSSHLKLSNPVELANHQVALIADLPVEEYDESQLASNDEIIKRLFFYKPTRSRVIRGEIDTNIEKSGVEINAVTSPYNKKSTMMEGV
jgi:hypothetical protein